MDGFLDERFPVNIAFGALGGPERRTEVVALATGYETRNARWADSRRRFDVATGIRSLADLRQVLAFFEMARGRLYGFRFKDPVDHATVPDTAQITALDQAIGTGDGVLTRFPLKKSYGAGTAAYDRSIRLPVATSLKTAVGGLEQQPGSDYTVDPVSGEVVFTVAPAAGELVTAGFEFDVPVRFDTDSLDISLTHFQAGDIPSIPLVEIRL